MTAGEVRDYRKPTIYCRYKMVDTCARVESETHRIFTAPTSLKMSQKSDLLFLVLGSGPFIGQGEFDYATVHSVKSHSSSRLKPLS